MAFGFNMYLFVLIGGVILLPQSFCLKCNKCRSQYGSCDGEGVDDDGDERVKECPVAFTRCGIINYKIVKAGKNKGIEFSIGACFKENECKNGSFSSGVSTEIFSTKCCRTNKCNTMAPRLSPLTSTLNGLRCYHCNEDGGECTQTQNCVGDQTYCATRLYGSLKKGCATESMCATPLSALTVETSGMVCCQGNFCNGGNVDSGKGVRFSIRPSSSSRAGVSFLLLSTVMLVPHFVAV